MERDQGKGLKDASLIWLATFDSFGKPGTVPVWLQIRGGEVYVSTSKESKKVGKLRQNKNVVVTVGKRDVEARFEGTCEICSEKKEFNKIMRMFFEKYGEEAKKWWGEPTGENLERLASQRVILEIKSKQRM